MRKGLIAGIVVFIFTFNAVEGKGENHYSEDKAVIPYANFQIWNTYAWDEKIAEGPVDDRFSPFVRRGRVGLKGAPYENLYYNVQLSFDNLGKDDYMVRGTNNVKSIDVWSAYFTWTIPKTTLFNLSSGFMLPHISRECTTNPWSVSSLDKAYTSCYLRRFVTGKNNGIGPGVNLGGFKNFKHASVIYNLGVYNNLNNSTTAGVKYAPLYVGRVVFTLGAPELKKYKYTLSSTFFGKKRSVSLGVGGSRQGAADSYTSNRTYGMDLLLEYNGFHVDGEYYWLEREASGKTFDYTTSHVRVSYRMKIGKCFLEPSFMHMAFEGEDAAPSGFYNGTHYLNDYGINWHIASKKLKLYFHVVSQYGSGTKNYLISNGGEKGDYAALALQVTL